MQSSQGPGPLVPPEHYPARELGLSDEPTDAQDQGLKLVQASPSGEVTGDVPLTFVFNRPMVGMDAASAAPPFAITPNTEGVWQWIGTHAVQFAPAGGRFMKAQSFRVSVPAGLRAMDGTALQSGQELSFSTPRPRVLGINPRPTETIELDQPFVLRFNQAIEPELLKRYLRVSMNGEPVAARVTKSADSGPEVLVVEPERLLNKSAKVELTVSPGLTGVEGPLAAEQTFTAVYETFGPTRLSADCGRCDPSGGLTIRSTNLVNTSQLIRSLRFEPPAPLTPEDYTISGGGYPTKYVYVPVRFQPRTRYVVSIAPGLVDERGQPVPGGQVARFTTSDYSPSAQLGVSGEVLSPKGPALIPIRSRNVEQLHVATAPVDLERLGEFRSEHQAAATAALPGGKLQTLTHAINNRFVTEHLDLAPHLNKGFGAVILSTEYTPSADVGRNSWPRTDQRILQFTELAISGKVSGTGGWFWVTQLTDNKPAVGAVVELWQAGKLRQSAPVDSNGLVHLNSAAFRRGDWQFAVARRGDDSCFTSLEDLLPDWHLPYSVGPGGTETETVLAFTERGVYRPGDRVFVKGVIRMPGATGNDVPQGKPYELELKDSYGERVEAKTITTSEYGSFSTTFVLPKSARLGHFNILLPKLGSWHVGASFEVAEYRPSEFQVSAKSRAAAYTLGQQAAWDVEAHYFFGGPMPNAKVAYRVTREPTSFAPPGSQDYVTSDDAYGENREYDEPDVATVVAEEGVLDATGGFSFQHPLSPRGRGGPERLHFSAEVTDVSRQALSATATAVLHPADFYLGIRFQTDGFIEAPGTVQPRVVAFSPTGDRLGKASVQLELLRRRFSWVKERQGSTYRTVSKRIDEVRGTCQTALDRKAEATCPLHVAESGSYVLRATSTDARGRKVRASASFYAIGAGSQSFRDRDDQAALELALDKSNYQVGENARVLVKSPFARGTALVTLEREGVMWQRIVALNGPTPTFTVPVTDGLRPSAYVGVHLLNAVAATSDPKHAYRSGYAPIALDPEAQRLLVQVQPRKAELRPGEQLAVDLEVQDAEGRPANAELTVYVVDEGVLSLTGYDMPDPVAAFTQPRPLRVGTIETRRISGEIQSFTDGVSSEKGREGGGGGEEGRTNFQQVAYFNPEVQTDSNGRAVVTFNVPDSLTTFRVMAMAVTRDDKYGTGKNSVVVNKPLMARPALPRFLRAGDELKAGIVVTNRTEKNVQARVQASVKGAQISGGNEVELPLLPNQSREVHFRYVVPSAGQAQFSFDVRSDGFHDAVTVSRPIQSPTQLETVAAYGALNGTEGQRLLAFDAIRDDAGGVELALSTSALVGLDGAMQQLVNYPYACTEQLASRVLPLLPLQDLASAYGFEAPEKQQQELESWLAAIIRRQRPDGGFGMWDDSQHSRPWVSAYALYVLEAARQKGGKIPERVFESGKKYLRQQAFARLPSAATNSDEPAPFELMLAAFNQYVSSYLGDSEPEPLRRLYDQRQRVPLAGRALMLLATAGADDAEEMAATLKKDVESAVALSGNEARVQVSELERGSVVFDSVMRTQALVLMALLVRDPEHHMAGPLVRGLLSARQGGSWSTTQESAFALLSLRDYWQAQENEVPDLTARVFLNRTLLFEETMRGKNTGTRTERIPMPRLFEVAAAQPSPQLDLVFQAGGQGKLFYEARLAYARREPPRAPLDRGFFVTARYQALSQTALAEGGAALSGDPAAWIRPGDVVAVDVQVVTPADRRDVVVESPLPAAFEAIDPRLMTTTPSWLQRSAHATGYSHRELRDDRALFFVDEMPAGLHQFRYLARATSHGRFLAPPTRALEMYQPEVFGRTAARVFEIQNSTPQPQGP